MTYEDMTPDEMKKLLEPYKQRYSPAPSRRLREAVLAIPDEVVQSPVSLWYCLGRKTFWGYLAPRLAGLVMACFLGVYLGLAMPPVDTEENLDLAYNQYLILGDDILFLFGEEGAS
ncbi:hypothetical protein [Luteithermobacter gelatinilyticus]|uniref:hypothetical protein n=1 Tax=Luteithermobacter gelatinilyticus TaxID=2582913 RepID=UPI0011062A65|nr:hypothetical protein [Luteithermobacter gelatinilyticus]|tara:strand:+ start:4318 stop:4665 length:348 start_codon:yes stop_codon:yes gene_type:complete